MAYSGKITFAGSYAIRDMWSYVVRFIVDSGFWSIVDSGLDTTGTYTYPITQSIVVGALNTWTNLTSVNAYTEVVKKAGVTLTKGVDYDIDNHLGRMRFYGSVLVGDTIDITYTFKKEFLIFFSTGYSGTEKIYIGIMPFINADGVNGYLQYKAYKYWQTGMLFTDTVLGTGHNYSCSALWNSDMVLWLFVNPQRVVLVDRIQTYYGSAYIGFFNRFALPHEYNYPLCVLTSDNTTALYSDVSVNREYIINARVLNFLTESNVWVNFPTFYSPNGTWQWNYPGILLPNQQDTAATNQLLQMHYPDSANIALWPVNLYYNNNNYGELDEVYFIPGTVFGSESEITMGADKYIIFEDVFRHAWNQFMAIKEA